MLSLIRFAMASFALVATATVAQAQKTWEILPDKRVVFRIKAPNAKEVKAVGQFGEDVVLNKGEKDLWTGTTKEAVAPGVHEYGFSVDGLRTIDPSNRMIKPQRWPNTSILHIPATPPALWDLQDIPHGSVHQHDYKSKALEGAWRSVIVYTPPKMEGPLPVLYLAHGYSDQQLTWTVHGKAHWIMDALIASGKAAPMIIVMPDAHAVPPETRPRSEFNLYAPENTAAFCDELLQDIMPLIESTYPVRQEASARAFAGLSMGGHHALTIALKHSEHFSQIGAFSSAPPNEDTVKAGLTNVAEINRNLKLLWVACGDKDFLYERNQEAHAAFQEGGLKHEYVITQGDDHSWPVWRRYLAEFVPKLFP